ncbi:MAG: hypothetical protein HPY90_12125 [Syntrophothermus sp.]|uniref:hypothetical protein n=1 Tax=Syntrophothermus sp. TaxID=2736299 RepID=UPI00257D2B29|nr:hypothetical protein [Syntrophothermus sp.]NSW83996.1 hypothetical protein [Syntrophothermus sp.]
MFQRIFRSITGATVVEALIIIALLCAIAVVSGASLRGGASTGASTVSQKITSYATGGNW